MFPLVVGPRHTDPMDQWAITCSPKEGSGSHFITTKFLYVLFKLIEPVACFIAKLPTIFKRMAKEKHIVCNGVAMKVNSPYSEDPFDCCAQTKFRLQSDYFL